MLRNLRYDALPLEMTLDGVEGLLHGLPREKSERTIEDNLYFVGELGRPERMYSLLRGLLADTDALELVSGRSYRHVNHFDKIVLVDSGDRGGYRLTLHLWRPPYTEDEVEDELIHDHRFSFWSTILAGNLLSENFERAVGGRRYRGYRYIPEKRDVSTASNFYEFVGESALVTTQPSKETVGSSYYLNYQRIHRVVLPQECMTCTLVLRGPREREFSTVYNTSYPTQDTRATNEMFTPEQVRERLGALLTELSKRTSKAGDA